VPTGAKSCLVPDETRIERQLDRWIDRAQSPRTAAAVIASVTTVMTIAAGLLMTVIDREGFPSIGAGLWWAAQTVTTVGYGDHVPETVGGRVVATIVMLLGIGFITVITASITGAFVARSRRAEDVLQPAAPAASGEDMRQISERLDRIEAALRERT
jgi:voltage-gated potassium channel Kch